LVVINTCTITNRADRDVRSFIRKVLRLNSEAKLIVTGCFAEQAEKEFENNPKISYFIRNSEKKNLVPLIVSSRKKIKEPKIVPYRSRALVKIQDGCDFRCSFCVIPSVRGKSISVEKDKIIPQIKEFVHRGFKEITLTGIHLCLYGLDLKPRSSLLELLKDIELLEGLKKIRLTSLDPRLLNWDLLKYITSSKKICPHFHLSLQHASDNILLRMGRRISIEDYQVILAFLRKNSPLSSIGADIMVGFPGESNDDFDRTYDFLEKSPLTYFHVFSYSPRKRTEAASWKQVNNKIKKERSALLRELSKKKNMDFRRKFSGKECTGIVISRGSSESQILTSNYFKVFVPYCPFEKKEEVRLRIENVTETRTEGQIIT